MKRVIIFFCILIIVSGMSFSMNLFSGPSAVQPGNFFISVGYNWGNVECLSKYIDTKNTNNNNTNSYDFNISGLTLAIDYTLPLNCITIGVESGLSNLQAGGTLALIPVMGRLGYHPDLGVNNLDLYGLLKIGFAIGWISFGSYADYQNVFSFGFGLGGRYFFGKVFGVFAELGIDSYFFDIISSYENSDYYWKDELTGKKIFTGGIIFKF
jgi:hypothetical protein